jgi:signal transduction histidine kinase/DNA-binding NarL/FixJ family response regulator/predicted RNA-binding protein with RPS1 domain
VSDQAGSAYQPGQVVIAVAERVLSYGVFARLADGTLAYVRRRELTQAGNVDPQQVVKEGQELRAVILALPEPGQNLELSVRQAEPDPWDAFAASFHARDTVTATVKTLTTAGMLVQVVPGVDGSVPLAEMAPWPVSRTRELFWIGDQVEAVITYLDRPTKRLRLSIRRQMVHSARVQKVVGRLRAGEPAADPVPEPVPPEGSDEEDEPVADLENLGRVLVVDDHPGVREELVIWLRRHGCQADGVGQPGEALDRMMQAAYALALVDLDLGGQDGLQVIRGVQANSPGTRVIVMSIPEWIAERSDELAALEVADVFVKPLKLDETLETLARLARGEAVGPFRVARPERAEEVASSFQRLARTMRSGAPLVGRLEAGLEQLVRFTQAELGVLFHFDPASRKVSIMARAGSLPLDSRLVDGLSASPVKDLILEGGEIFEPYVSDHAWQRFQKLLDVVDFESCLAVPVAAAGRVEHALFMFHRQPEAFSRYRLRDARAVATLLGVALESQALEARIQAISSFLLSGHLAAGFGHDVFNKMSALELQMVNLKTGCDVRSDQAGTSHVAGSLGCDQMAGDMARLLDTVLDLKRTVEAFRELIRAEGQETMDVNQVVEQAARLLQSTARRNLVRIETEPAPELPPVPGNAVRLQQAFLNVMLNAIQHMARKRECWPDGPSRLRVTRGVDAKAEHPVWVRFADTGPGIHRELWDDIFALGFSTRPGGTGLGLFIARSLVESMGGTISVEQSLIPSGTTFRIELPAV